MANNEAKALHRLRELRSQGESIDYSWQGTEKLKEWKNDVEAALRHGFGQNAPQIKTFKDIQYSPMVFTSSTPESTWESAFTRGIGSGRAVVTSAIRELEHFSVDDDSGAPGTVSASQSHIRRVFVVHGHDNEIKETVARFLEKLGFETIILHERPSGGATVVEKIEDNANVGYAVVLLTPDDIGGDVTTPGKLNPRARQNVILELGYFLGRLGRDRVCAIVNGRVEFPSDFAGIVYVPFEGEVWKTAIVKELVHLGFQVDANKIFQ